MGRARRVLENFGRVDLDFFAKLTEFYFYPIGASILSFMSPTPFIDSSVTIVPSGKEFAH